MKTLGLLEIFMAIFCCAAIVLLIYGAETDCPNTAGYVYCENKK